MQVAIQQVKQMTGKRGYGMKNIKIKIWEGTILPEKHGDWIDLRSRETIDLEKGDFTLIHLGVAMQLPDGYEGWLVPRSSSFKKWGIIQTNGIGIIDNSYRGDNDEWCMPVIATRNTTIHAGDRVAQFRISKSMSKVIFDVVDSFDTEDRGGFGSSGVN